MKIFIVLLLIVIVLVILYKRRNRLNTCINQQVSDINELNTSNPEIEFIREKFSAMNTKELTGALENYKLTDNEFKAIEKVLSDRQLFPNQFSE